MQVTVDAQTNSVLISLDAFKGALVNKSALMKTIGAGQLVSIRRTFAESGVPKGSWAPLAASTLRNKHYTPGHKLLIGKGRLLSSINAQSVGDTVIIGTSVIYAAVQNFGSRDRGGAIGPQARLADRAVQVKKSKGYSFTKALGVREVQIENKLGNLQSVKRRVVGPENQVVISGAKAHSRFQNIPARPFMVFRPEDPQRIRDEVTLFMQNAARKAGLL